MKIRLILLLLHILTFAAGIGVVITGLRFLDGVWV